MYKYTVEYSDLNGAKRREDLYFNLTEYDIVQLQAGSENGIEKDFEKAVLDKDVIGVLRFLEMLIHRAYGVKTADGRYHQKSPEILEAFKNSVVYSTFMMELFKDGGRKGAEIMEKLMPAELIASATAKVVSDSKKVVDAFENTNPVSEVAETPNPYEVGFSGTGIPGTVPAPESMLVEETGTPELTREQIVNLSPAEFQQWAEAQHNASRPPFQQ